MVWLEEKPYFKALKDVFVEVGPYVKDPPRTILRREKRGNVSESNGYHGYCDVQRVSDGAFLPCNVIPTPELVAYLREEMILVNHDTISFKVCIYADGTGRVWAKYNQILGSRFLCELTAEEASIFNKEADRDENT